MGYHSTLRGEWEITPPLNGRETREIAKCEDVWVRTAETERETDEGVVTIKQGVAIVCSDGEFNFYDIREQLQRVLSAIPTDRDVLGEIVRVGEENGDVERFVPRHSPWRVESEQAQLRWPDGTEVQY